MKTIVTGGAGFIGSHLTERLIGDGHQVTVLDDLSTGRRHNLKDIEGSSKLAFLNIDVSNFDSICGYFKDVDWVFHLAALADIVPSITHPRKYHHSNVESTVAVLEASRINRVKKFVYAASSSCYGIPDIYPTPETASIQPQYPYAFTKYIAEQYVLHWHRIYRLPFVSLRLFNVYGLRSRTTGAYGAVIGVFLAQKLNQLPFTIVGDGQQKRDFIFVSDIVDAFVKAASSQIESGVFNVGSGQPQSINKLASLLGADKKIYIPKRPGEPDSTWADITKIKEELGWRPQISFEQGIKLILENIDYWRDAPAWTPEKIEEATKEWFRCLS